MMRYLKQLADRDYALDRGMIPLGSCTMKLNAATEMAAVSWPEFSRVHPFAPPTTSRVPGAHRAAGVVARRDHGLRRGVAAAERRLAGRARGAARDPRLPPLPRREQRDVCLIPSSAHGTNAASAVLAGMRVVVVACDDAGNVDLGDLRAKIARTPTRSPPS
jgi:glycine dehydrogenase